MLETLGSLSKLELLFLALAILGILVSIFLYLVGRRVRLPVYIQETHVLVQPDVALIPDLTISYRDALLDDVKVPNFAIWNRGRKAIRSDDNAPRDPIRIHSSDGGEIIAARIDSCISEVNNFFLDCEDFPCDKALLKFDFFSYNQGVLLSVYHSGSVELRGTVIGAGNFKYFHPIPFETRANRLLEPVWALIELKSVPDVLRTPIQAILASVIMMVSIPIMLPAMVLDQISRPFRREPRFSSKENA